MCVPCSPGANVSKYLPLVHYRPSGSSAPENRGRNVRRRYQASHDGDVPLAEEPLHCQECLLGFCMGHIAAIDYFGSHDAQPRSVTRWPRILDKATNSRGLATACHAEKGGLHPTRGVHQITFRFLGRKTQGVNRLASVGLIALQFRSFRSRDLPIMRFRPCIDLHNGVVKQVCLHTLLPKRAV